MKISDLARGERSKKAGHWRLNIEELYPNQGDGIHMHRIYHYSTLMVEWDCQNIDETIWIGIGHGSVSDQGGINQLCQALGVRYRMDRYGDNPRIRPY